MHYSQVPEGMDYFSIGYEILLIGGQQLDGYNRIYQRIRFELERKFLEI